VRHIKNGYVEPHSGFGDRQVNVISRRTFISLLASALAGCSRGEPALPIVSADLVQVAVDLRLGRMTITPATNGSSEAPSSAYCGGQPQRCSLTHVRDIRDPLAIGALLEFVNTHLTGWYEPWYGLPIGDVEVYFLQQERRIGTFGSGSNFFSRGSFPQTKIIASSNIEIRKFRELVHIQ
jgi:hypothetical protein